MYKINGIEFFPPIDSFDEALKTWKECGGIIISLENNQFLVDETDKIMKLYQISEDDIKLYFIQCLKENGLAEYEINEIIKEWDSN
jgi:hypothetical protein